MLSRESNNIKKRKMFSNSSFAPNSSTGGMHQDECQPRKDTDEEITVKCFAYSIVLIVAVIGNTLVVWVVHRTPGMRQKAINMFIVNLAVADLLLALFTIPRVMSELVTEQGRWFVDGLVGAALCKFVVYVQEVATAVSVQCLVIIAVDRFRAVVYPLHSATTSKTLRLLTIPVTWFLACALHSPDFYTYRLAQFDNQTFCIYLWTDDPKRHFEITRNYYLAMFCILVFLPMVLLIVLYSGIWLTLKRHSQLAKVRTSIASSTLSAQMRRKENERNVLRMAVAIVTGFAICQGPLNVYVFLRIFVWDDFWSPCNVEALEFIAPFLTFANSALNPILYFAFSENFRHGFKRVFARKTASSVTSKYCLDGMRKVHTVLEDKFVELQTDSAV